MKSRITIEVDFDNGNQPFIQIINNHQSPDVRDKLITQFRQMLGGRSRWLRVDFPSYYQDPESVMITLHPITEKDFKHEGQCMIDRPVS
jgi:hypothetical protein